MSGFPAKNDLGIKISDPKNILGDVFSAKSGCSEYYVDFSGVFRSENGFFAKSENDIVISGSENI